MKKLFALIVLILQCFCPPPIKAVVRITPIPSLSQLPVSAIHRIFQDSEGYMWYGTVNGLCRDDGYRVRTFRSDFHTPGLLRDNLVAGIAEDQKGRIWFTTNSGAYILDKKDYRVREVDHRLTKGHRVEHVFTTRDGSVWMGVEGCLLRFRPGTGCREYPLRTASGKPGELNGFCEDRRGKALVGGLSVKENVVLSSLKRFSRLGVVDEKAERSAVEGQIDALSIRLAGMEQRVVELSGGNQQKVVFAKVLLTDPKVFLCDEPTQAVDVMTRGEIHKLLRQKANEGAAVVYVSSDLKELLEVADNIRIMSRGRTRQLLENRDLDSQKVLSCCYEE